MLPLVAGIGVLIVTAVVIAFLLPRDGKTHRLVGTEWESYINVALCAAIALGLTMVLSGVLEIIGPAAG